VRFVTPVAVLAVLLHGIGIIEFNKPPVVPPGALFVKEIPTTPSGENQISISATFEDPDQPAIEDFSVTFRIRRPGDTADAFVVEDLRHGAEGLTISDNGDGTYTARYSFRLRPEYLRDEYGLYFEVSDGSDVAVDSLTDYLDSLEPEPDTTTVDSTAAE